MDKKGSFRSLKSCFHFPKRYFGETKKLAVWVQVTQNLLSNLWKSFLQSFTSWIFDLNGLFWTLYAKSGYQDADNDKSKCWSHIFFTPFDTAETKLKKNLGIITRVKKSGKEQSFLQRSHVKTSFFKTEKLSLIKWLLSRLFIYDVVHFHSEI